MEGCLVAYSDVGVVGAVAVPHAPQFFTLPDTEDHEQVARIERTMGEFGERLLALKPDAVVVIANDHLENFLLHSVPSFTVLRGPVAKGSFAGRDYAWPVASEAATRLVIELQEAGFDPAVSLNAPIGYEFGIPMTFLGIPAEQPVIPIFVNSYLPPQPSPNRCYEFGKALHRSAVLCGLRLVVVASGGLSHYPGTDRYGSPDLRTDRDILSRFERGNLRSLLSFDAQSLDITGNVEARSWLMLAGAIGERVPSQVAMEPSWHHNYAMVSWDASKPQPAAEPLHYPIPQANLLGLYEALYALRNDPAICQKWLAEPAAVADDYELDDASRAAVISLNETDLARTGVHPLLGFLARLNVNLVRGRNGSALTQEAVK
jgi:2,3-dihydroxyphenylpropionate 1,2-dioxygenase